MLALALAIALLGAAMAGVTWFDRTLIGRADFADVVDSGQVGGLIGGLSDIESGWFQGLLLFPVIIAPLLLLTSLPRSRRGRMIAVIMWLIPLAGLLIWLPFGLVHEIRATGTLAAIGGDQSERVLSVLMAGLVPATVIALLAWAAYRGRIVGPASIGAVLAMAATAIHLVLLLKLLQGTGAEEVSVAVGPWLAATGLATMAAAGWILTGDAARWRRHALGGVPSGETPNA